MTESYLVLYSFCANLMHSLILWLMVSSLSPHSQHLLFCCVLSILYLVSLVLMALFCGAISGDSVSLFKFPFLSQIQFCRVRCCLLVIKTSIELLSFLCLFLSYCHSVVHRVISIVSHGYNQSSIVFLYIVLRVLASMHQRCLQC